MILLGYALDTLDQRKCKTICFSNSMHLHAFDSNKVFVHISPESSYGPFGGCLHQKKGGTGRLDLKKTVQEKILIQKGPMRVIESWPGTSALADAQVSLWAKTAT